MVLGGSKAGYIGLKTFGAESLGKVHVRTIFEYSFHP